MSPDLAAGRRSPVPARQPQPPSGRPHSAAGRGGNKAPRVLPLPTANGVDGHVLVGDGYIEVFLPLGAVLGEAEQRKARRVLLRARRMSRPRVPEQRRETDR